MQVEVSRVDADSRLPSVPLRCAMSYAADVVTVPDFDGPSAGRFRLATLLFLAAWLDHRGASRSWPLHLACIGEPPASVRRLADKAGAHVSVHAPLLMTPGRTSNKLRGFEVAARTDRMLLMDTDVLILRDLAPLADLVSSGIGVGPATVNHFTERTWRQIYQAVEVPYPGPTGTCWCADTRLAGFRRLTDEQRDMCRHMPPYFNSGVVMAPRALDFGTLWGNHLRRVVPLFTGTAPLENWGGGGEGDEHALATAVESCRQRGAAVVPIPWPYHTRPILLRSGFQAWSRVALFHYHGALKPHAGSLDDLGRFLENARSGDGEKAASPARWLDEFRDFLRGLMRAHIRPVLGEPRAT
ncbi:MAG: hypothetical protein QME77_08855 [bacterium]|nr:hypothetical protein [bacterium]